MSPLIATYEAALEQLHTRVSGRRAQRSRIIQAFGEVSLEAVCADSAVIRAQNQLMRIENYITWREVRRMEAAAGREEQV